MIHEITSDHDSFKSLTFGPGLNVVLADKSPGATDLQSRNGAGKTSLVELIHFLCGADAKPKSIFRAALKRWNFQMSVDIAGVKTTVSRSGVLPNVISVSPPPFHVDGQLSDESLSNSSWKELLGETWFGLPPSNAEEKYRPSFRSLFSYVARRQIGGGFNDPVKQTNKQQEWDSQASICHMVNLDSTIPAKFQQLRDREKSVNQIRKAINSGEFDEHFTSSGELRTPLAIAVDRSLQLRNSIENFSVHPEYRRLEEEASQLTQQISDLNTNNVVDQELIDELKYAIESETPPASEELVDLYEEAGTVLPAAVRKQLRDVESFHEAIVENRRFHLQSEIDSASSRISERDSAKTQLDSRRQQIMRTLQGRGALDHYMDLREELGQVDARCEVLRQRLEIAEQFENTKAQLDGERAVLTQRMQNDIHERQEFVNELILKFESLSKSLYERAGSLNVSGSKQGPKFETIIESQRSLGISNMQIFCFDLTLTELGMANGQWPGFLIHDSHLFDGVDERQVAKALQLGEQRARDHDFQYIVTMNSDSLPRRGYSDGFRIEDHIVETRLTDATETGGLFGVRF